MVSIPHTLAVLRKDVDAQPNSLDRQPLPAPLRACHLNPLHRPRHGRRARMVRRAASAHPRRHTARAARTCAQEPGAATIGSSPPISTSPTATACAGSLSRPTRCAINDATSVRCRLRRASRTSCQPPLYERIIREIAELGEPIEAVAMIQYNEPTADRRFVDQVRTIKEAGLPAAVLSNGSAPDGRQGRCPGGNGRPDVLLGQPLDPRIASSTRKTAARTTSTVCS